MHTGEGGGGFVSENQAAEATDDTDIPPQYATRDRLLHHCFRRKCEPRLPFSLAWIQRSRPEMASTGGWAGAQHILQSDESRAKLNHFEVQTFAHLCCQAVSCSLQPKNVTVHMCALFGVRISSFAWAVELGSWITFKRSPCHGDTTMQCGSEIHPLSEEKKN